MKFSPGKLKDIVMAIKLWDNNMLWIQYTFVDIFYDLNVCINKLSDCQFCAVKYYFKVTNQIDAVNSLYGEGILDIPFTSSSAFM